MLAYDYPLLGAFWTITVFAMWVIIVFTVVYAFIDNYEEGRGPPGEAHHQEVRTSGS